MHYFDYGPNSVEIVDSYTYLGIIFHFSGKFKASVSNLADKARKAFFALKAKLPCNNNLSAKSWLKLYNSMVVPILTYGSKVWITEFKPNVEALDKTQFEKTQNMILKNILGVHNKSSNTAVKCELGMVPLSIKCELGMVPLSIKCYGVMYGYYSRLNQIDEQLGGPRSLLKAA